MKFFDSLQNPDAKASGFFAASRRRQFVLMVWWSNDILWAFSIGRYDPLGVWNSNGITNPPFRKKRGIFLCRALSDPADAPSATVRSKSAHRLSSTLTKIYPRPLQNLHNCA
jgi:hypothetical protein